MAQTVLSALLPVVFVVAIGLLAVKYCTVPKTSAPVFADFVVRFALPLALLNGVLKTSSSVIENIPCLISTLLRGLAESALVALVCAFPNMAYSGSPVLDAVVGQEGILAVIVGNVVTSVMTIPVTLVQVQIRLDASPHVVARVAGHIFDKHLARVPGPIDIETHVREGAHKPVYEAQLRSAKNIALRYATHCSSPYPSLGS
ncbi:AEC family transporter [Paraburkholderia humisilvae]|uniref:Uncharacterized protein n=1 Tax=Paraburkholderia humisilvae TaxID=627669 RepID=A0A6J5DCU4_9BURK|nr:AEC family transporter [Paraburkholderia humisilvae]CAB3750992.1 hypothetical protein LMG29542_01386 [Paraburkholderia humisilvae]